MNTRTLLTAALFVASGLTAQAQVVSFSSVTKPTGPQPRRVAFGDITADGSFDLVTFNVGDVGLSLFRNDFSEFTYLRDPNGFVNPLRVFVTDFDLDGRADYIVGKPDGGSVRQANDDGDPYGAAVGFSNGGNLSLGDLNNDGLIDIVGEDGTVWRNDGNTQITNIGGFAVGTQSLGSRVADVDFNGNLDVIIHDETMAAGDTIYVSLGNGDGTYADPSIIINTGELDSIQVIDVSNDGWADIVGYSSERNVLEVRLNDTLGGFTPPQTYATGAVPRDMLIGQFAASGLPAIALLCADGNIRFWVNDTTGVFTGPALVNVGTGAVSMAASDFNFDGSDDLAVVNETGNTLKILTNTTPDAVLVSGMVVYGGRDDGATEPEVTLRAFNSEGVEMAFTVNEDRTFSVFLPRGNWQIRARSPQYLSEVAAVNTSAGEVTGVGITLRAGDANLDNAVDIGDLLVLISAYNKIFPAAGYSEAADFNGDFRNDITDLLLLIGNYNELGE